MIDRNTIEHSDWEPYRDLFFLSALRVNRRMRMFIWTARSTGGGYVDVFVPTGVN
jgi:hypothetical protein